MDPYVRKTLAVLRRKRAALVQAHEAELSVIDAAIAGIERYGVSPADDVPDLPTVAASTPPVKTRAGHKTVSVSKTGKSPRAPRGHVPRLMLEAFHAQPGHFSVREVRAFLDGRHSDESRRISAHRLSNEMLSSAKKKWIKLVTSQKGGPNTYMKRKLPPIKQ